MTTLLEPVEKVNAKVGHCAKLIELAGTHEPATNAVPCVNVLNVLVKVVTHVDGPSKSVVPESQMLRVDDGTG